VHGARAAEGAGADAIWFGDCNGSGHLISPNIYREFAIESGVAWPPSDYDVDVVPDPGALTTLPKAGWCEAILRIAEIGSGGVLHQYLYLHPYHMR